MKKLFLTILASIAIFTSCTSSKEVKYEEPKFYACQVDSVYCEDGMGRKVKVSTEFLVDPEDTTNIYNSFFKNYDEYESFIWRVYLALSVKCENMNTFIPGKARFASVKEAEDKNYIISVWVEGYELKYGELRNIIDEVEIYMDYNNGEYEPKIKYN